MKRTFRIGAIGLALVASTIAAAQTGPAYHVKDEVVVKGTVTNVATIPDWMGKDGVNLALNGLDGNLQHVDVATASFLQLIDFSIATGDALTLRGCWGKSGNGEPVFLVHEMIKDRVTINVRDQHGIPIW